MTTNVTFTQNEVQESIVVASGLQQETVLPAVVHALGGAIGSALSILLCYPLERIRVEMMRGASCQVDSPSAQSEDHSKNDEADTSTVNNRECASENVSILSSALISDGKEDNESNEDGAIGVKSMSSSPCKASSAGLETPCSYEMLSEASTSTNVSPSQPVIVETISSDHQSISPTLSEESSGEDQMSTPKGSNRRQFSASSDGVHSSPNETALISGYTCISAWSCFRRLQKEKDLYTGVVPVMSTLAISSFIYFYAHEILKKMLLPPKRANMTSRTISTTITKLGSVIIKTTSTTTNKPKKPNILLRSFLASAFAGVINVLITNPVWVASMRIMQRRRDDEDEDAPQRSLPREIHYIWKQEGIAKLWGGTCTSLLLVLNPALNHFLYERIRSYRKNSRSLSLSPPAEVFVTGAFAKTIATVVTYPLQLAQVLLRVQKEREGDSRNENENIDYYSGTWNCISSLYRQGGLPALFVGMDAKLMQTVLTAAFTFLTYEQILSVVRRSYYRGTQLLSK
mmetsp:Transcript_15862/g.22687  ORF Transcript_15862/g.22687 Transcript_15862/m.22687 type:complete len:516 (+) Transcript_15862:81-1628(+)